ncbi:AraC family transcriptional regulator [Metarhizobium album]|uniref:AraC family transcriptional regulator n=1 Tax=Metarhizobium album TaxID=2182425 RepID=A0A2U2DSD0_9HYPH|nr:AraC family transcriptional regulator [Rhizobium album]PWE56191.1 AraC family transcriptional regulator [Rhizobium album]
MDVSASDDYLSFRSYGGEAELHCHNFHQIVLPRLGVLELEIGGKGGVVASGRGAVIPAGTRHAFRAGGRNGFIVVDARCPALDEPAVARYSASAFFEIRPAVQALLDHLSAAAGDGEVSASLRTNWCSLLYSALSQPAKPSAESSTRYLDRALAFMRAHVDRPLGVSDIAREAGVGETRLHGLFRTHHGTTPHAMLMEMRLDAALDLLANTELPIADIALLTGHPDQSALTRRLRQSRGITPLRFRKGH